VARIDERSVFLNVPFDPQYEEMLVWLIAGLVSLSRTPRSVLEIAENGSGRLERLQRLIAKCRVSIHDLSRVGTPVRFNMPFELGLACATASHNRNHDYILLEKVQHRLDRTLSDLKGRDPYIHRGSPRQALFAVLDALAVRGNHVDPDVVCAIARRLHELVAKYKRKRRQRTIFNRMTFNFAVEAALRLSIRQDLIWA
jgi:hypothetical protein